MFQALKQIFARGEAPQLPLLPEGQRVYAVGDIHGRLDLFRALVEAIEADDAAQNTADTQIILLGDLVDRGDSSRGVIDFARELQGRRAVRILAGNHEEMFLRGLADIETFRHFIRHGGRETLLSYGIDRKRFLEASMEEAQDLAREAVPADHIDFLNGFEDMIRLGDYVFVHAGIDPRVALEEQRRSDLRWIREPFLSHEGAYGAVVVHGHTIVETPQDRGNRIGIDTGAYMSGRLTALALEGTSRRYIEAVESGAEGIVTKALAA
ncbi:MAG TPA: metallophosphoesterase family protein [Croceibacterium sp.]|nr:metallophosphoesterase family protein [Croceibacterium sp.]